VRFFERQRFTKMAGAKKVHANDGEYCQGIAKGRRPTKVPTILKPSWSI
jgi:hypothetical protein